VQRHTLAAIVARLGGRIAGDPQVEIIQVGTLEHAGPLEIAFLSNPRYKSRLATTRAGAIVVAPDAEHLTASPRIVCDDPYAYFARLSQFLNPQGPPAPGIHPGAHVAAGARVAASAQVGPGAVIGAGAVVGERCMVGAACCVGERASIGDDSRLYPSVVVYPNCRIGARAILHSGVVIGADGFGIAPQAGRWLKIPQIGKVVIGEDVEIGANTTIDRGAIDDTLIGDGVKLDNQIQIGHNVQVGAHTAMAGCVGVAGSARIGSHCTIGAGALILGHLSIADHVVVSAATVVTRSLRQPGTYTGLFPIDEHAAWSKNAVLLRHLDELAERLRQLERRLSAMEKSNG
jgi:UDP-3-O-[3-hydroxymyristoyl] glucosamine N-acyltransferase